MHALAGKTWKFRNPTDHKSVDREGPSSLSRPYQRENISRFRNAPASDLRTIGDHF